MKFRLGRVQYPRKSFIFCIKLSIIIFYEFDSFLECPEGNYGKNCSMECNCQNDGVCNKVIGSCDCLEPGYYGDKCQYCKQRWPWQPIFFTFRALKLIKKFRDHSHQNNFIMLKHD